MKRPPQDMMDAAIFCVGEATLNWRLTMARNGRMGLLAAASAALILISVLLLWTVPAEADETTDEAMTYLFIGIYVVGLALTGPAIYYMRVGPSDRRESSWREVAPPAVVNKEPQSDDSDDYISDIEREFRALEMEIDREEHG